MAKQVGQQRGKEEKESRWIDKQAHSAIKNLQNVNASPQAKPKYHPDHIMVSEERQTDPLTGLAEPFPKVKLDFTQTQRESG